MKSDLGPSAPTLLVPIRTCFWIDNLLDDRGFKAQMFTPLGGTIITKDKVNCIIRVREGILPSPGSWPVETARLLEDAA